MEVGIIPVLEDNYIFVGYSRSRRNAFVVDPAVAEPVLKFLDEGNLQLDAVINTHHHWDHIGGNLALKSATGCKIIGAKVDRTRIPGIDLAVDDGDRIAVAGLQADVLRIPGHTMGHLGYHFPDAGVFFAGDTLFNLGCGRLFEGSAEELYSSLKKIKVLPPETLIYCTHEYTIKNGAFALSVDGQNCNLQDQIKLHQNLRAGGHPTIPMTLASQLEGNPFLRSDNQDIQLAVGTQQGDVLAAFTELRKRRDRF
jgi:hydroxyacylglutathione hydrolase